MTDQPAHARDDSPVLGGKTWLAIVLLATAGYLATAQRTVSWQDSGEFQWRCLSGDLEGTMGLARAHPLYIAVGSVIARLAGPAMPLALNAFSGLGMAVALATFAAVACRLSGSRLAAVMMAALLGLAHTAWWLSTIAEVYTWSLAALAGEVYLLLRLLERPNWRWLSLLALVNGLGLCVHNFALLGLPVYGAVVAVLLAKRRLPARALLPAGAAWLLGAGLYIGMTIDLAAKTGSLLAAVRSALVGDYALQVTNVAGASKHLKANAALSAMNVLSPLLPLAALGWWRLRHWPARGVAAAVVALTAVHVAFFVRYPVPDQFTFILPSLLMVAMAASVGLGWLLRRSRRWRTIATIAVTVFIVAQPAIYLAALQAARQSGTARRQRRLPYRDEARYWLLPWKQHETSAHQFASTAFLQAEPGSLIWPESTSVYPLMVFQRLHGRRPDVAVQYEGDPVAVPVDAGRLAELAARRPLYVVAPSVQGRFEDLPMVHDGVLYRVLPRVVPRDAKATDTSRR